MHIADAETVVRTILNTRQIPYREDGQASLNAALARPLQRPYGQLQFKTPLEQAGALMESINIRHPLIDGNKRTAWALPVFFLESRSYEIEVDQDTAAEFVLESITTTYDAHAIALWLADRI
jgi:death-on-curing protein